LVRGWLHSSGLLSNKEQLQTIAHTGSEQLKHGHSNQVLITLKPQIRLDIEDHRRLEYASSSCGVCGQQSIEALLDKLPTDSAVFDGHLDLSDIYPLSQSLRNNQPAFAQTGGNHGAGLFELVKGLRPELLDVREDVGRHNALDKLIGANLSKLTDGPGFYGVVLSGRVSFDLVQKAAMANIKFIIAIGAPSSLAIELANECDICVVGFVKETSLNLYSAKHYIEMQTTTIDPLQEPYRESK
jgi:FdhD protein